MKSGRTREGTFLIRLTGPADFGFAFGRHSDYEVMGSRDDILAHTSQPYVWSWAYPNGSCADHEFVQRKLARAGYLVARTYPDEMTGGNIFPDLQGYATNPYQVGYTQTVEDDPAAGFQPGIDELNAKFDQVYQSGGLYHFVSHPQWLAHAPYEQHLAYVGRRSDVWYVPLGPLYAYRTVVEETKVRWLLPKDDLARLSCVQQLRPGDF